MNIIKLVATLALAVGLAGIPLPVSAQTLDCTVYNFTVGPTGSVDVVNGDSLAAPAFPATVRILNQATRRYTSTSVAVPALTPGSSAHLADVVVPVGAFSWSVVPQSRGPVSCGDTGSY